MDRPIDFSLGALFPDRKSPFPDKFNAQCVRDRRVLITGAGGSIGSALSAKVLEAGPRKLFLLDHSVISLTRLRQGIAESDDCKRVQLIFGDVRDEKIIEQLVNRQAIDIIFHAAAYKHVPLLEGNLIGAARNNGLATWNLAKAAASAGVKRMILISTDKAANPKSVLGASKRIAELALARWRRAGLPMCAMRLGNVAGSSGSVIPVFQEQIVNGRPVTLSHPAATRYFLTMEETLSALGALAAREGASGLFVPEMGEPIPIMRLAEGMIELASRTGRPRSKIETVGLRPGDKLQEDLLSHGESLGAEIATGIFEIVGKEFDNEELDGCFERLKAALERSDRETVLAEVKALVPHYEPARRQDSASFTRSAAGASHD